MKLVPLSKYRINARHIAELMWGTGGTHAIRTNRAGAYYYSCSGHGGYVVDHRALTIEELEDICHYQGGHIGPHNLHTLLVRGLDDTLCVAGVSYHDFAHHAKRPRVHLPPEVRVEGWFKHPVYLFEEDCDWSILETFTDIRTTLRADPEQIEEHEKAIKATRSRLKHDTE